MCSPCLCTLSASASIHPPIPTFGRFLLEIFLNFLFLLFFVTRCRPRTCGWCVIRARAPTNGVQQLTHSAPTIEKRWSYVAVTLKTKRKSTIPREFPGYWWLFRTQHLSRYSARLAEERRRWTILIFDCFRFATLKQLLHFAIITADWGRSINCSM